MLHGGPRRGLQGPQLRVHISGQRNMGLTRLGAEWLGSLCLELSTTISETSLRYQLEKVFNTFVGKRGRETRIRCWSELG